MLMNAYLADFMENSIKDAISPLTHYGLMTPNGGIDLGQNWHR